MLLRTELPPRLDAAFDLGVSTTLVQSPSMILVGPVLTSIDFAKSRLYAADFSHGRRKARS
jgi:hypothetical protein